MIFSKDFNKTITLIITSNKQFKETYKFIASILPKDLIEYSKINENIKINNDNTSYEIITYKNEHTKEENIKLILNDYKEKCGLIITVSTIGINTLKNLPTDNEKLEIASIAIENKKETIEYIVEIKRIGYQKYEIETKTINNQNYEKVSAEKISLTYNEIIQKLNINMIKR